MARLMRMTIVALVALAIMGLLPLAASAQMIGFVERTQEDIDTNVTFERDKCMRAAPGHLTLTSTEDIPAGTQVTYVVRTVEGHDIFRNHGVQVLLAQGSMLSELKGNVITAATTEHGTNVYLPGLCWADNRIDGSRGSGSSGQYYSVIEIQLVSVSDFSIDFASSRARYAIPDEDYCTRPHFLTQNQGKVFQIRNGRTCTCTTKSTIVMQGLASGEEESYAESALNWRIDSTNYCPDSPYQRPGN